MNANVAEYGITRRRKSRRNFTPSQHEEQVRLIQWVDLMTCKWPELRGLYAIPNLSQKHKGTVAKFQAEGARQGVPPLHLAVSRGTSHGLYIVLMRKQGGRVDPDQRDWIDLLRTLGNTVEICRGWEAARDLITEYLALPEVRA